MTKEELAKKEYPDFECDPFAYPNEVAAVASQNLEQARLRYAFMSGFDANKLTWQDIRKIDLIISQMIDEDIEGNIELPEGDEAYYTEALKRFEAIRNQSSTES